MIRILCILVLLKAISASAEDQTAMWTGNGLLANCSALVKVMDGDKNNRETLAKAGLCSGYLVGFSDGLLLMQGITSKNNNLKGVKLICTPRGTSLGQIARIVEKFLKDHPDYLHEPAGALSYAALEEVFPCP